jgi:hypothetical protein
MAALKGIERYVARCESPSIVRAMKTEIARIAAIAQADHDTRSDLSEEWVEVVLFADALRLKAEHQLESLLVEQADGLLHPLFARITKSWLAAPCGDDRRAA